MKVPNDNERIMYIILIVFALTISPLLFTWLGYNLSKVGYTLACIMCWAISSVFGVFALLYFADGDYYRGNSIEHSFLG